MFIFFYVFAAILNYTGWLVIFSTTFAVFLTMLLEAFSFRFSNDWNLLAVMGTGLFIGAYLVGMAWTIKTTLKRIK